VVCKNQLSWYPDQGFSLLEESAEWIMTISAFFDESGKFKDQDVVTFCGVAAPALQFQQHFANDWLRCLNANDIFSLTAKEAFNSRRPLSEKNPALGLDNRIDSLLPFLACIRKHIHVVTGVAINVKEFKKLPSHYYQLLGNNPHFTAFLRTILKIIELSAQNHHVSLVCDDEEEMALPMYKMYRRVKLINPAAREQLRAITFADDRFSFGLQAADLIASIMRLEARKRFFGTTYDYEKLFAAISSPPKEQEIICECSMAFCGHDELTRLADGLKKKAKKGK
jgi:hypothetical protein